MGTLNWDILELARQLRFERLFVSSEQQHLQILNDKVLGVSSRLAQLAWVTARQRDNLNCLIVARPGHNPTICCRRANLLENTSFIDGYKILGFQVCSAYGELLSQLRSSPYLLASCLTIGDSILSQDAMTALVHALAAGLLGGALLPGDRLMTLRLLQNLIRLELVTSENPRRLLRPRASSFSRLYAEFHEGLFEAKLFLTAALHQPIMQLLIEDEEFLDIDPIKTISRFSEEERLRRFGPEDGADYAQRVDGFGRWTLMRLARLTERFVESLRAHMHCFPSSLSWLVRQLAGMLTEAQNISSKEVAAICTDLVFTCFVCPAIVNPEPYGITDAPISSVARINLMHVARTIQSLAVSKQEGRASDPKVAELHNHFPEGCVSSLLDSIIENAFEGPLEEPVLDAGCPSLGMARHAALLTESELYNLVSFLQSVSSCSRLDNHDRKRIKILLESIPNPPPTAPSTTVHDQINGSSPGTINEIKRSHHLVGKKKNSRAVLSLGFDGYDDNFNNLSGLDDGEHLNGEKNDKISQFDVLVIPFSPESPDPIGIVPEHKILRLDLQDREVNVDASDVLTTDNVSNAAAVAAASSSSVPLPPQESLEKRTRFSLSHDDGSIGNTSDNLEAVSEAASNHSVASSLELEENEDQNDNLSDMVSANVSGRGTPNISGRDTPSSQMTEGDDDNGAGGAVAVGGGLNVSGTGSGSDAPGSAGSGGVFFRGGPGLSIASGGGPRPPALDLPPPGPTSSIKPQIRNDIDDKFGKFEIKKLLEGDETVSLVSDTWSTDVLASDSETLDAASTTSSAPATTAHIQPVAPQTLLDVSETASEAWSTDVLTSDTERMTEVDTDDTASVARSDDTTEEPSPAPSASASGLSLLAGFRPIREDAPASPILSRGQAPSSPTRTGTEVTSSNLTGRGGDPAESRLRTVEYVGRHTRTGIGPNGDSNDLRLIHVIDKPNSLLSLNRCSEAINPSSSSVVNNRANAVISDTIDSVPPPSLNDILVEDQGLDNGNPTTSSISNGAIPRVVRLSSASLASTSSSSGGSASGVAPIVNGVPSPPTQHVHSSSKHGAIPKSISFDKTAERGDKDLLDEDHKQRRGFFRFKLPFKTKPRSSKSLRGTDDLHSRCDEYATESSLPILRRGLTIDSRNNNVQDTTEDILAKYRNKTSSNERDTEDRATINKTPVTVSQDERLSIDPNCVESSYAFADAKKKLRLVLSTADLEHALPDSSEKSGVHENELVSFLQMQLAEAINLGERPLVAHLHETLRCIRLFDDTGCRKLFDSLKEDLDRRAPYIAYLVRCRQGLLSTLAHLERLAERIKCDRQVCSRFLVAFCVSLFLEKREGRLFEFVNSFQQLGLPDEKSVLLDAFLNELHQDMNHDITWQGANEHQLEQARQAVERAIFSRVYKNALYPNGDGDVSRDDVLHLHMHKLSNVITPNHKDLRIPKMFHYECPWPSAQAEIALIAAYKTPRDKVHCVHRCATTIMNLLALACEQGTPAADDFVPVFVYVLIKANPPSLLSTIQYVNSFYGRRLSGEEQYWWVQFCSAIEFIKTMDYPN